MNTTAELRVPDQIFFETLRQAPHRLLLLDYDGTLSPFVHDRFQAFPYPGVPDLLNQIIPQANARLVIVTGRPLQEIIPLLNMSPLPEIWGSHGWEHLHQDGTIEVYPMSIPVKAAMDEAREKISQKILIARLDIKPGSLAIHWRGLPEAEENEIKQTALDIWGPYDAKEGLMLKAFDGGLELRAPGRDKGTATRHLLEESPAQTFAAYLGDDLTDEDAFAALTDRGEGILVRNEFRPTQAKWWLHPPRELLDFLRQWRDCCQDLVS